MNPQTGRSLVDLQSRNVRVFQRDPELANTGATLQDAVAYYAELEATLILDRQPQPPPEGWYEMVEEATGVPQARSIDDVRLALET